LDRLEIDARTWLRAIDRGAGAQIPPYHGQSLGHQGCGGAIRPKLSEGNRLRQDAVPRARLDGPSSPRNNARSAAQGGSAVSEISETGQYHAPLPSPAPSKTAITPFHPCSRPKKTHESAPAANPGGVHICHGCFPGSNEDTRSTAGHSNRRTKL